MTLRETISSLLANSGEGSDPAAALAEAGYGDVDAGQFGTALVHFSDTASMPEADALAPIATRSSTIPFEESDLPEADLDPDGDSFAMFASVDPDPSAYPVDESTDDDSADPLLEDSLDPAGIDGELPDGFDTDTDTGIDLVTDIDGDAAPQAPETTETVVEDAPDAGFGGGDDTEMPVDPALSDAVGHDIADIDDEPYDDGFEAAFGDAAMDDPIDEEADLFSVDFTDGDDPEADPLDLDFE